MRLPIIPPAELNAEQKPLAEDMKQGIAASFQGFVNIRDDGALLGPWNPWIHEPKFGKPVWELTKAMASNPSLPGPVREVAMAAQHQPDDASWQAQQGADQAQFHRQRQRRLAVDAEQPEQRHQR